MAKVLGLKFRAQSSKFKKIDNIIENIVLTWANNRSIFALLMNEKNIKILIS